MFLPGVKTGFVMLKFAQGAFAALMLIVVNGFANAQTAMIDRFVPDAALVGEARFKVLLFPVYDASLYAPKGDYRKSGPLALELNYLFDVEKERIVNQTVKTFERRKLGSDADVAKWRKIMGEHFSDVQRAIGYCLLFLTCRQLFSQRMGTILHLCRMQGLQKLSKISGLVIM